MMELEFCWECWEHTDKDVKVIKTKKGFYCPECGALYRKDTAYLSGTSSYDSKNDDEYYGVYSGDGKPAECRVCGCDNYPKCMDACHLFGN